MHNDKRNQMGFLSRVFCVVAAQIYAINDSNMMKLIRSVLISVLMLIFATNAAVLAANVEITLRECVATESSVVRLGDVATIVAGDLWLASYQADRIAWRKSPVPAQR